MHKAIRFVPVLFVILLFKIIHQIAQNANINARFANCRK